MARRLTTAEKLKIVELHLTKVNGRSPSYADIATQTGRSAKSVKRTLDEAGFGQVRARPMTTAEKQHIIDLYRTRKGGQWLSTVEVGRIVGRSPGRVYDVLVEAGADVRTKSEAHYLHVPEHVRQEIIRIYMVIGSIAKVARHLRLKPTVVYKVLDETDVIVRRGPNSVAKVRESEAFMLVALYRQGRSAKDVARLTGRSIGVVHNLVRQAGVMRPRKESARLAMRRIAARNKLAKTDLQPLAGLWIEGAEVEELAREFDVPPDLMWDALADELSRTPPTRGPECTSCVYACAAVCARTTQVGTSRVGRRY